jgi:uncharacterized membrane protein (DUF4010 family)
VNSRSYSKWLKPLLVLIILGLLTWLSPDTSLDPWGLIGTKKIILMVFALTFVQIFGAAMSLLLGVRGGAIIAGFFGGLVSSTATTASLARRSKLKNKSDGSRAILMFLSATLAMLFEGITVVWAGSAHVIWSTFLVFTGPVIATVALIYFYSKSTEKTEHDHDEIAFKILPILKLALFIIAILFVSKILQNIFGNNGLMILTFLVSLFEIHGSIIANVQLHDSGTLDTALLVNLIAISISATFISKIFLIFSMGSPFLKKQAANSTLLLFISLLASWVVSISL